MGKIVFISDPSRYPLLLRSLIKTAMIFNNTVFNGYKLKLNTAQTTNFNSASYTELDIVNSLLRGKVLHLNIGPDSDHMKFYSIRITGILEVNKKFGYYDDALLICGKWAQKEPGQNNGPTDKADYVLNQELEDNFYRICKQSKN